MEEGLWEALEVVRVGPVVIVPELLVTEVVKPALDVLPPFRLAPLGALEVAVPVDAVPPVADPVAVPEIEPLRLVATQAALF